MCALLHCSLSHLFVDVFSIEFEKDGVFFVSSYYYMAFRVLWDHFTPFHCLASTEAGTLHYIDVRKVGVNTSSE